MRRDCLVIVRSILACAGVPAAPSVIDVASMLVLGNMLRPLKHHVLEKMGKSGKA